MKILDVRDGFIKFEADSSIYLSSFVRIEGMEKIYIAQVSQLKRSGGFSIAYAKILFLYDGSLLPYDKTLPSTESSIKEFTFNILNNSINAKTPVIAGITSNDTSIIIDASAFNKKMLASIDEKKDNNIIVRNLVKQFNNINKNILIIDTLGVIDAKKITAGSDFKLPLDTASLAFMYQDCLNDATADSKSLIIEIFKDLSDYSKTVPFVPFDALKTIVDDMVDKSHIFKLLVLKNKLAKFDKLGYFAKDKQEVDKIDAILNSKCTIIDLSKLDAAFQNRYLAFLYEKLQQKQNTQVILELSNVISKKNLKNIMSADDISTTFITHSRFKYLNDIKNLFDNFIISPSFTNNEIFNIYNTFLKAMPKEAYLIAGEAVNYIPIISKLETINEVISFNTQPETTVETEETEDIKEEIEEEETETTAIEQEIQEETEEPEPKKIEENIVEEEIEPPIDELAIQENGSEIEEFQEEAVLAAKAAAEEEPVEEHKISNEEIIANIEEKSEAVITEAAKNLTPPTDMFGDNESKKNSEEGEEQILQELDSEKNEEEEEEEEEILQAEYDNDEEAPGIEDDLTFEAEYEEIPTADELEEPIEEQNINELEYEELPLADSFDTIQDEISEQNEYISEADDSNLDELTLNEELEENYEQELQTDLEEAEIEIPEGFDLDLDTNIDSEQKEAPIDDNINLDDISMLPLEEHNYELDEIVELDPDEADENDIIIDMEEDNTSEEETQESLDEQIVKDVDKVFTTRKEDDISDSDLDFIDQLNSDDGDLLETSEEEAVLEELSDSDNDEGILEEPQTPVDLKEDNNDDDILETKSSSTPIVPVYDADIPQEDLVMSDPIEQGDTVAHAKYGNGVVEKMIKYGNKTLFSINFDNIGRRLLDPTLTEIKLLHS